MHDFICDSDVYKSICHLELTVYLKWGIIIMLVVKVNAWEIFLFVCDEILYKNCQVQNVTKGFDFRHKGVKKRCEENYRRVAIFLPQKTHL